MDLEKTLKQLLKMLTKKTFSKERRQGLERVFIKMQNELFGSSSVSEIITL